MKRTIKMIIPAIVLVATLLVSSLSVFASSTSTVKLTVNCYENMIFALYDVDVYLDGEYIGTIENGQTGKGEIETYDGNHELMFCSADSAYVYGTQKFTTNGYTTVACNIQSHEDYIEPVSCKVNGRAVQTQNNELGDLEEAAWRDLFYYLFSE